MTVVADTGPLYALIDRDDAWHRRVLGWWQANREQIVVPSTVVPEVTYLLQQRLGVRAESAFLRSLVNEELGLEPYLPEDLPRSAELVDHYADLRLGFVDASVVAIAERLGTRQILTTDHRHFPAIRPAHGRSLALLP